MFKESPLQLCRDGYFRRRVAILQAIARGEYNGNGTRIDPRGIIIEKATLKQFVAPVVDLFGGSSFAYTAREALVQDLLTLNYNVGFLCVQGIRNTPSSIELASAQDQELMNRINHLKRSTQDSLSIIPFSFNSLEEALDITWPRDIMYQLGSQLFVSDRFHGKVTDEFNIFLKSAGINLTENLDCPIGEAGNLIVGPDYALVSDFHCLAMENYKLAERQREKMRKGLEKAGIASNRIFPLPMQYLDILNPYAMHALNIDCRLLVGNDHVDFEAVSDPLQRRIAFGQVYSDQNQLALAEIIKAIGAGTSVMTWPETNTLMLNPADLPRGEMLFNRAVRETIGPLFSRAGFNVRYTAQEHATFGPLGGVRCSTTVLWQYR
ncbi:MAG: hypothetical protein WC890_07760 [Candidatus Margulisiibacteriota bacterium]